MVSAYRGLITKKSAKVPNPMKVGPRRVPAHLVFRAWKFRTTDGRIVFGHSATAYQAQIEAASSIGVKVSDLRLALDKPLSPKKWKRILPTLRKV